MISKDKIRLELLQIAKSNNLAGESVELLINELTYALYHNQLDITNAIQESNLSTAHLMNSKIRSCMNVMYPVYRGKNLRVKMKFINNTHIIKNKFDTLYSSNTFKVFAEDTIDLLPSTTNQEPYTLIGIISTSDVIQNSIRVTQSNRYYIDFKLNQKVMSNLSEEVIVSINDIQYKTTRNFFDFNQQTVNPDTGEYDDEQLFILTLPDYGIRLYRKNYFTVSDIVTIKALKYTTVNDIAPYEFSKICIPGTDIQVWDASKNSWINGKLDIDNVVKRENTADHLNDSGCIPEINRDDTKSLLQSANHYQRLQASILSNSDLNLLFSEYFIDDVLNSINYYNKSSNVVNIYYVPRVNYDTLTSMQISKFRNRYKSYFISDNLIISSGKLIEVNVDIVVYLNNGEGITEEVATIFNKYSNRLHDPNSTVNIINKKLINSEISKISNVSYIDSIDYNSFNTGGAYVSPELDGLPPTSLDGVPTYYQFKLNLVYKTDENLS